ncbi:MAG: oxidoreductase [Frankiales bacterium]|nr:oxidoreductase [Frankiales bacterium]
MAGDTDAIRTALIGYGLAGSAYHAPPITVTDGLDLTTIVTRSDERASAARARYPGVRIFRTPDEVWTAGDLDLVVVASPNRSHVPLALAAIQAGLHVVIDKPVAATAADAALIRDAALAKGVTASVFHNRRWDGSSHTLRELVAGGALGAVHRFEARFDRWRPWVNTEAWREGADPADAGGLLYDLGSHLIDQALTLFGPVTTVYAEVRALRPGAQVDDEVFVALTHAGGTVSHLWASSLAADLGPWVRVLGSAGAYVKEQPDSVEPALRAGGTPGDAAYGLEPESAWGRTGTVGDYRPLPTRRGGYEGYYAELRDALRSGSAAPVTMDEAVAVMAVIEAAQRSAREGGTVVL